MKSHDEHMYRQAETETNLTFDNVYRIVNGESAISVSNCPKQKTCVTCSIHAKGFINLGSASNTYKYSFFSLQRHLI